MTVKFFPLFFKEDYGFRPVDLCCLAAVYAVSIGLFMLIGERLANVFGKQLLPSFPSFTRTWRSTQWPPCVCRSSVS